MEIGFKFKLFTVLIITVILYFGILIAYEHPLGGITGYIPTEGQSGFGAADLLSFFVIVMIILGIFAVAYFRHGKPRKGKA